MGSHAGVAINDAICNLESEIATRPSGVRNDRGWGVSFSTPT